MTAFMWRKRRPSKTPVASRNRPDFCPIQTETLPHVADVDGRCCRDDRRRRGEGDCRQAARCARSQSNVEDQLRFRSGTTQSIAIKKASTPPTGSTMPKVIARMYQADGMALLPLKAGAQPVSQPPTPRTSRAGDGAIVHFRTKESSRVRPDYLERRAAIG
jgi:hypothetical protein